MGKSMSKALVLSKETVRNLDEHEPRYVVGGAGVHKNVPYAARTSSDGLANHGESVCYCHHPGNEFAAGGIQGDVARIEFELTLPEGLCALGRSSA